MSNLLIETAERHTAVPQTRFVAESLGSRVLQLCPPEVTLARILDGELPVYEDSVIFDPNGRRVNTFALLQEVEVQYGV